MADFWPTGSAFRLRFGIANEGTVFNDTFQLRVSVNGGAYNLVTTSSSPVRSVDAGSDADETKIYVPRLTPSD